MHLQDCVTELKPGDELVYLQETLETFIESHWSPTHKPLPDLKRIQKSLLPLNASRLYEKMGQAVGWARKQYGKDGKEPCTEEALDLSEVTRKIREALESTGSDSLSEIEKERLQRFYGMNWFKCPRVSCIYYYQGFRTANQLEHHTNKHTRPYQCTVVGCHMAIFGCTTKDELRKHLVMTHGLYIPDDEMDEPEYPDPPKEKPKSSTAKPGGKRFTCDECDATFTRSHNLKNHKRTHAGVKPYACSSCGIRFTRKPDCDRHERDSHGDSKKFICSGPLKSGEKWGCGAAFPRAHKLAEHLKTAKGQKCVRPLMLEKLRESGGHANGSDDGAGMFDGQIGENADALLAAGKLLPSFKEFIQSCGLDMSTIGAGPDDKPASSAPSTPDTGA
jgi:hypothetical protein